MFKWLVAGVVAVFVLPFSAGVAYMYVHRATGWDPWNVIGEELDDVDIDDRDTFACKTCDRQIDGYGGDECPECGGRLLFNSEK